MIHTHTSRFVLGLLGLFALVTTAEAQRPSAGRPSGGGGRPSAPSVSRPSVSRPSAPSMSRPSAPSVSRPSAPSASRPSAAAVTRTSYPSASRPASPTYQRGSTPAPTPQPRYEQPSAPRYEAPSARRYEAPSAPRYEQPSTPRYEAPAAPRYDAPTGSPYDAPAGRSTTYDGGAGPSSRDQGGARSGSGRSAPTPYGGSRDDAGRIYDGGRGSTGPSGRIEPARIDRDSPTPYQPRVWQPDSVVDLSGAVRAPRIGVPSISGSRSGPEGGLASGRLARAGFDAARPAAAVPHPEVSADALRARYGAATPDSKRSAEDGARAGDEMKRPGGLSTGRTRSDAATPTKKDGATTRTNSRGERKGEDEAKRGSRGTGSNRRVADAARSVDNLETISPLDAGRTRTATRVGHAAGTVGGGIVVGGGSGDYNGNCWDPDASHWNGYGWYWNTCWRGSWWWSWSFGWPYGSCWWYGPSYGNSYWPYGYGYSSWGWCVSPYAYTSVIYVDSDPEVVYVERPADAPVADPSAGAPVQGAVPKVAPEIKEGLEKSADEALAAGDTAFREGRFSDAVRHYARAVEFSPERGSLWLILSDALFATGDYHYAAYAFRRSIDLDATLLEMLVDKHGWYANPSEFDRHIAWAEAYLRDHVLDEDARLILAANYLFAKRFASASDALESAFGAGLAETPAGRIVLERARRALGIAPK